jgi:hypothetical protein
MERHLRLTLSRHIMPPTMAGPMAVGLIPMT